MKKTLLIFGTFIGLGTIGFVLYKKGVFGKKEIGTGTNTNTGTGTNTTPTTLKETGFPLKKGSTGSYVKILQRVLNASIKITFDGQIKINGTTYKSLSVDGIFGNNTYNVSKYLLDRDIDNDGVDFAYLSHLQDYYKIY